MAQSKYTVALNLQNSIVAARLPVWPEKNRGRRKCRKAVRLPKLHGRRKANHLPPLGTVYTWREATAMDAE